MKNIDMGTGPLRHILIYFNLTTKLITKFIQSKTEVNSAVDHKSCLSLSFSIDLLYTIQYNILIYKFTDIYDINHCI